MIISVDGLSTHAATGGVALTGSDPIVVLVHGAGMDATAWQLQTRYLAHHGFRPIAVDLPGHGRSDGKPLASIAEMADWLARFIEAATTHLDTLAAATTFDGESADHTTPHVVGHSMGTFIGLELAKSHPELVRSLVLLGTADAMAVHPELLRSAVEDLPRAAAFMASWSHDKPAHIGHNPTPGQWMLGGARALVENSFPGALAADFTACATYGGAVEAAASVTCPVVVGIGRGDKMTPPRAAATLVERFNEPTVIHLDDTGHAMMTENPQAIRKLLLEALSG